MRALNEEDGGEGGDQDVGEYLYKGGAKRGEILTRDREGCGKGGVMKKSKPPKNRKPFHIYIHPPISEHPAKPFHAPYYPITDRDPFSSPPFAKRRTSKNERDGLLYNRNGVSEGGRALMV